jgi:hypothetical protein
MKAADGVHVGVQQNGPASAAAPHDPDHVGAPRVAGFLPPHFEAAAVQPLRDKVTDLGLSPCAGDEARIDGID